ncbi:uncharacterized protein LOC119082493 [Bradysia coprophila]|uniref:uncharacterized protein LOC119082493 n=1 Tax=Bradysia coprophila TaxID=38358 RepID=UPI00187DBCD9|nr:uncharacterized protein LOC119082493 [Bradysia coprophila]
MPPQCSRKGNCCCHRIDNSVVEGIQANQWYRNKVQAKLEFNSKEHHRHRPSSAWNLSIRAPVEPHHAHHVNHTANAEHRHFDSRQMNSKSGQSCNRNVDETMNQYTPIESDPNWKRTANRNSFICNKGVEISNATAKHIWSHESNQIHRHRINDTSDHWVCHHAVDQSSRIHCGRIYYLQGDIHGQIDLTNQRSGGEAYMARLFCSTRWSLAAVPDSETGGTVTNAIHSSHISSLIDTLQA